ncbi:hypothetical protein EVAR_72539_1 [Eumeta japonica]|uniref:Uncharacterized protein n=1 Tax=Eumeta variegata TaxID=151549 RepID=A0A4C1TAR0_EUMVA|nr:hypothetical protein EVAR_72539_1 [Eumeta japonica]
MLTSCLNTASAQNGGKVLIKDILSSTGKSLSVLNNSSHSLQQQQPSQQQQLFTIQGGNVVAQSVLNPLTISASGTLPNQDFLNSIIQAVGIQGDNIKIDKPQTIPQYTITVDNNTVQQQAPPPLTSQPSTPTKDKETRNNKSNSITTNSKTSNICSSSNAQQQKNYTSNNYNNSMNSNSNNNNSSKITALLSNLAPLLQPQTQLNAALQTQALNSVTNSGANMLSPNKCFLPITIKDENTDQQFVAHIDAKNFLLPTTYQLQMKLLLMAIIMQLAPTSIPATLQLAPQGKLKSNIPSSCSSCSFNNNSTLPTQLIQHQQQNQQLQATQTQQDSGR